MRYLSSLALLTLAAAASAQTFVLSPYRTMRHSYGYPIGERYYESPSALVTSYSSSGNRITGSSYSHWDWIAGFELPEEPDGTRLVSATLATTAVGGYGAADIYVQAQRYTVPDMVTRYVGRAVVGEFEARAGDAKRLDFALPGGQSGRYASIRFSTQHRPNYSLTWSTPTLAVTYGPAVTIPIRLGDYPRAPATWLPAIVEFRRPGALEVVSRATASFDADGSVTVGALPGTYDVAVKVGHWLRRVQRDVTVSGPTTLSPFNLVNGDVNRDGVVSAADRAIVTSVLGKPRGSSGNGYADDLNGDGYVTAVDRAIVTAHLGSVGDN